MGKPTRREHKPGLKGGSGRHIPKQTPPQQAMEALRSPQSWRSFRLCAEVERSREQTDAKAAWKGGGPSFPFPFPLVSLL